MAEGGHGEVWEAVQGALNRTVAVKRIRPRFYASEESAALRHFEVAFRQEAIITGFLDHPAIVPIYDLGRDADGRPVLAMKLVEGEPWHQVLERDRRTGSTPELLARHLPVLVTVAQAVAFAHSRGIMHRDLKPSQVVIGRFGEVFLMDWGLAAVFDAALAAPILKGEPRPPLTNEAPCPAGTTSYMAPEQTDNDGARLGPWTDVYLLGATLYSVLTGTAPHPGSRMEAFAKARATPVEPPQERAPHATIPDELAAICMRALAFDPAGRHASAAEFCRELEEHLGGVSRRSESEGLVARAQEIAATAGADYRELARAEEILARALTLWPGNAAARGEHDRLLERHCRLAVGAGDLGLARMQAGRIAATDIRTRMMALVQDAEQRRARLRRRRYQAAAACFAFILLGGFLAAFMINHRSQSRAQQALLEAQNAVTRADAEREAEAAQAAEDQARLRREVSRLYEAEAELGREMEAVLGQDLDRYPDTLAINPAERVRWAGMDAARIRALETRSAQLAATRRVLAAPSGHLAPPPPSVVNGAGYLAFRRGVEQGSFTPAAAAFGEAARHHPGTTYARVWQARCCFLDRRFDEAQMLLQDILPQARSFQGIRGTYQVLCTLVAEVEAARWASFHLGPGDILVEPRAPGGNPRFYRETLGNWGNTDSPREFARSVAPGTTPRALFGSRCVRYTDLPDTAKGKPVVLPAEAVYDPDVPTTRTLHAYVTWGTSGNATPAVYVVRHASGTTTISLTQDGWGAAGPSNAHRWTHLGQFTFVPEAGHNITLRAVRELAPVETSWNGQLNADAMLFTSEPLTTGTIPLLAPIAAPEGRAALSVRWHRDFDPATTEARIRNLPLLAVVYASASRLNALVETQVYSDPLVAAAISSGYVPLRLTTGGNTEIAWRFRDRPLGSVLILNPDGTELLHFISAEDALTTQSLLAHLSQFATRPPEKTP